MTEVIETPVKVQLAPAPSVLGSDRHVAMAAWSSTKEDPEYAMTCPEKEITRIIRFLMRDKHASPFGHPHLMLDVRDCPLFVLGQWLRHRSWASFSVLSLRYTYSLLRFYRPDHDAVRMQEGRPGHYTFTPIEGWRNWMSRWVYGFAYWMAAVLYLWLTRLGVAKEIARAVLPEGTLTRFYATVSLRNAINFLVLREDEHAQFEIRQAATALRKILEQEYPLSMAAWEEFGRPQL
jgi:thymidylate synthase (FAD)